MNTCLKCGGHMLESGDDLICEQCGEREIILKRCGQCDLHMRLLRNITTSGMDRWYCDACDRYETPDK